MSCRTSKAVEDASDKERWIVAGYKVSMGLRAWKANVKVGRAVVEIPSDLRSEADIYRVSRYEQSCPA